MNQISDPTFKHRRYRPLKENGILSRKEKWLTVNWANADTAIARFMGVDRKAVAHQRRIRGLTPRRRGGPRYPGKPKSYQP